MNLDDMLREELRRKDPGVEFTRRVLAGVEGRGRRGWLPDLAVLFRVPRLAAAVALGICLALVMGGLEAHRRERVRADGELAKQQLVTALKIAGAKLHQARAIVYENTREN